MRFVSLFAGVGGFDLAFERAGMECVGQVEIDTKCREVLTAHWPDVPKWEDIHDVKADRILTGSGAESEGIGHGDRTGSDVGRPSDHPGNLLLDRDLRGGGGSVDVLCGGFPCQDYSVAGKRGGLVGDRGALWWQFHRLIDECRPEWVVGENVPGLLSSSDGRDFGAIVGSLVELGYGVIWRILDAQYFGVAQRRRRVFIVGHIGGVPRPEILSFAEGCTGDTPPRREAGSRVAALTANGLGGGGPDDNLAQAGHLLAETLRSHPRPGSNSNGQLVAFAQNTRDEVRDLGNLAGALAAQPGMKQTTYLASPQVRRLTPLECERLQGFPDNWTASQSDTQRYRQMGNAVAVPVAEWIGHRLAAA